MDWLSGTRIEKYAIEHHLAVIMPTGENAFYVDSQSGVRNYSQFVGKELVEITRRLFPLSNLREDTFIGGLSMGGYGALINGLLYCNTFSKIGALSPVLMLDSIVDSTYDEKDVLFNRRYYEEIYTHLETLKGSEWDYYECVKRLTKNIPEIYLCCGENDVAFIDENRKYHQYLEKIHISHTYHEEPGSHEWDFWDRNIKKIVTWLVQ
ncbi:MAG: acetylesterase [Erysipelotrichaceae bacterium]|nr:acetylesterase [Erysipelotrichaceae bacterium]